MKKYIPCLLVALSTLAMEERPMPEETAIPFYRFVPSLTSLALTSMGKIETQTKHGSTKTLSILCDMPKKLSKRLPAEVFKTFAFRNFTKKHAKHLARNDEHFQLNDEFKALLDRSKGLVKAQLHPEVHCAYACNDVQLVYEHLRSGAMTHERLINLHIGAALSDNTDLFYKVLQRVPQLPRETHGILLKNAAFYNDTSTLLHLIEREPAIHVDLFYNLLTASAEGDAQEVFDFLSTTYPYTHYDYDDGSDDDEANKPLHLSPTILTCAARNNSTRIIKSLIEQGINICKEDFEGYTPIVAAIEEEAHEAARLLIEHLPSNNLQLFKNRAQNYLWEAAHFCNEIVTKILIERIKADPRITADEQARIYDTGIRNPLEAAIQQSDNEIVALFLASGARLPQTIDGIPTIFYALDDEEDYPDLLKTFIDHGIDLNALSNDQKRETALHRAVRTGAQECVVLLLEAGANTTLKDSNGNTAADVAEKAAGEHTERTTPFDPTTLFAVNQEDDNQEVSLGRGHRTKRPADEDLDAPHKFHRS